MSPPEMPTGYESKTITFKNIGALSLELDIMYPRGKNPEPVPVLIHYHGGFLVSERLLHTLPVHSNDSYARLWVINTPLCHTGF
jgi:acetyl esterase/lipase